MTQTDHIQDLRYSLAKRVPYMMRGFKIVTNYGEITIDPEFAEPFRNLAFEVIKYQINLHENNQVSEKYPRDQIKTKKTDQPFNFLFSFRCPKCQVKFTSPVMRQDNASSRLTYQCKRCSTPFALVLIFNIYELPPDPGCDHQPATTIP